MAKKEAQQELCEMTVNSDGGELTDDRISQLPQNVIHDILTKLPLKDAAKTALMSTQWRHHWRTIPQLVFDDGFERITEPSAASKLIIKVYKSLLFHDGPVNIFVLKVQGLTPCDEIDCIVHHVFGRGVQKFTLEFSVGDDYYKVPSSLFTALQLKDLQLQGCLLMVPPWFVRFSELTRLVLIEVSLPSDFLEQFLSKCPFLERLALWECEGLDRLELELDAPRLKVFNFAGDLLKISIKHAPLLSELELFGYGLQELDFVALFASLPLLQKMNIGSELLEVLAKGCHVPSKLPTLLHLLRTLHVDEHAFGSMEDAVLVCLIMSSPNLHTFTIKIEDSRQQDQHATTSIGSLLEAERGCGDGQCLQHLRVFEIKDSVGTPQELELVRFVLAVAPRLSRVLIKPSKLLCFRKVIKFMTEVLLYKRVSEAEIVFDWNDDNKENRIETSVTFSVRCRQLLTFLLSNFL